MIFIAKSSIESNQAGGHVTEGFLSLNMENKLGKQSHYKLNIIMSFKRFGDYKLQQLDFDAIRDLAVINLKIEPQVF